MGPRWVLWRAAYALRQKTGRLRLRFPTVGLDTVRLADVLREGVPAEPSAYRTYRAAQGGRFFFAPGELPDRDTIASTMAPAGRERTLAVADDVGRGRFVYYSRHVHDLGRPVDWLLNPFRGARHEAREHWCDYPTFSPTLGDVKDVWEPSRFACAYALVRAYALTGDAKYPATFWALFESWAAQNPPNRGPNWKCGQETALRTMAWCFALYGFWNAPATTADRVALMVRLIALEAQRIAANIDFAIAQKNNHGLSEATGLLTVGLLFPELRDAAQWEQTGRRVLERELARQVYADGSYVQHSMNYHRVMLHDCLWALRLAELNERPLSPPTAQRVARAGEFLHAMLDRPSGRVPNYGANDGANVLPLSSCDYIDYRPTVQAASYAATQRRVVEAGPWDEMLIWLYGAEAAAAPVAEADLPSRRFDAGGYYTVRRGESWCMMRCHRYRDRVGHVDPLHLDVWWRGVNVVGDSGSFRYYAPDEPAMEAYFIDIAAHNTIELDGRGPLDRVGRFLFLPRPRAVCLEHSPGSVCGAHYAYRRQPWRATHRRSVRRVDERTWLIRDELLGAGTHNVALRWHLADGPIAIDDGGHRVELSLPCGTVLLSVEGPGGLSMAVHRGDDTPGAVAGWVSSYYAERQPRPTVVVSGRLTLPTHLVTRIVLGGGTIA